MIGALSACAESGGSNAELTKEKKKEISRAWLQYKVDILDCDNISDFRYYGNYNGYDMFLHSGRLYGLLNPVDEYEIGGQKFINPSHFELYAYRNGKFYDLTKIKILHFIGIISKESLAAMAETHKKWFSRYYN